MIEIPRGDEIGKSEELKRLQVEVLKKRVREPLRKLDDIFKILGPHSPYYVFILTMNAIMFAVFNHFNEMDQFLIYSDEDVVYSDERGRIIAPEYPSVINQYGQYATSNGAMDLTTLTILTNISSMAGCFVALLIAKWSFHKTIVTFAVIIVISFLISQAFLFNFFDRITFFVGSVFSKALSIVTLQAAFESGQGKYRVVAIGFCFYLNNFIVFITLLLFKKTETMRRPIICSLSLDSLLYILYSNDIASVVDDILYVTRIPRTPFDSFGFLMRIKSFINKLIALAAMIAIKSRLNAGETEMFKTLLPYSPIESILISRIIACISAPLAVYCILKIGRRPFILLVLSANLFFSYILSLVPIDSFSICFSKDMPSEEHNFQIKLSFFVLTALRTSLSIVIFLVTLEHIPTIHRSNVFPAVMLLDSVFSSLSDASPYWMTDLHDTPQFIRPMIRYSIIGLLIAARFIDNTEVSVFHIVEIPCYNSETAEWKKKEARDDFEEKFRVLCEVKAVENEVYRMQETQQNVGYDMECTQYTKNRNTKAEMKLKIREKTIDPNTRKELRTHYIRKQQKNKRCIEDLKRKLTRQDDETKGIIYSLQKNRLKS